MLMQRAGVVSMQWMQQCGGSSDIDVADHRMIITA